MKFKYQDNFFQYYSDYSKRKLLTMHFHFSLFERQSSHTLWQVLVCV
jgi:hypothetical protein